MRQPAALAANAHAAGAHSLCGGAPDHLRRWEVVLRPPYTAKGTAGELYRVPCLRLVHPELVSCSAFLECVVPSDMRHAVDGRSTERREGYAIHMYTANRSMDHCCLSNADGDFLIVPQQGVICALPVIAPRLHPPSLLACS